MQSVTRHLYWHIQSPTQYEVGADSCFAYRCGLGEGSWSLLDNKGDLDLICKCKYIKPNTKTQKNFELPREHWLLMLNHLKTCIEIFILNPSYWFDEVAAGVREFKPCWTSHSSCGVSTKTVLTKTKIYLRSSNR